MSTHLFLKPDAAQSSLPGYPLNVPIEFFEDFIGGISVATAADSAVWRAMGTNAAVAGCVGAAIDGGAITITTAGAQNDEQFLQLNGTPFYFTTGRPMTFAARIKTPADLAGMSVCFGMMSADETDAYDEISNGDIQGFGVYFPDTGVTNYCVSKTADAATGAKAALGKTLAASTWYTFRMTWDGETYIHFYIDDVLYYSYSGAQLPHGVYLSPLIGCEEDNTGAAARSFTVDYVYVQVKGPAAGRST